MIQRYHPIIEESISRLFRALSAVGTTKSCILITHRTHKWLSRSMCLFRQPLRQDNHVDRNEWRGGSCGISCLHRCRDDFLMPSLCADQEWHGCSNHRLAVWLAINCFQICQTYTCTQPQTHAQTHRLIVHSQNGSSKLAFIMRALFSRWNTENDLLKYFDFSLPAISVISQIHCRKSKMHLVQHGI